MSLPAIRTALETALAAISPAISIAYENAPFTPVAGAPYAACYLLPASPDNPEIGGGYVDRGIFQVSLFYPLNAGPAAAVAQAERVRAAFPRGAAFTSGGVTIQIEKTPEIAPGRVEEDRFLVPVKVRFFAQIIGG